MWTTRASGRSASAARIRAHRSAARRLQVQEHAPRPALGARHQQRVEGLRSGVPASAARSTSGWPRAACTSATKAPSRAARAGLLGGGGEARRQGRFVGQCGAPCGLGRGARQQTCRRFVAGEGAGLDQLVEPDPGLLGERQRTRFVGRGQRHQRAGVGCADVGAQVGIELQLRGADRAHRRKVTAPRRRQQRDRDDRGERTDPQRPAQVRQPARREAGRAAELAPQADPGSAVGREDREHVARAERRRDEAGDREHAELRETGKAREDQRREAAQRRQQAEPHGRPAGREPPASAGSGRGRFAHGAGIATAVRCRGPVDAASRPRPARAWIR
jgi:hypothetical protein